MTLKIDGITQVDDVGGGGGGGGAVTVADGADVNAEDKYGNTPLFYINRCTEEQSKQLVYNAINKMKLKNQTWKSWDMEDIDGENTDYIQWLPHECLIPVTELVV